MKIVIFALISFLYIPITSTAESHEACSKYVTNPDYREVMDFFSYRLKESVAQYGCGIIPVYYAFSHEKSNDMLGIVEDNPQIMNELMETMASNEKVAQILAKNPGLAQALAMSIAEEDGEYKNFLSRLKNLNSQQMQMISQGKPATAALAILVPNLSPTFLSKNFTSNELDILLALVSMCALTSASADIEGMPQLIPYFTTNPNDASKIYKEVIRAWGQNGIKDLLIKNAGVVPALVPPLSSDEMKDYGILNWTPEQFHSMQLEYISIMRDVYKNAAHDYGPSWAREICMAFTDSLAAGLLVATPTEQANIRKFLLEFIGNGELFRKIFLGSGCFETNNIEALGEVINNAGVMGQLVNSHTQPLTALADWFVSGQLSGLLQDWLKTTDATQFSVGMQNLLEKDSGSPKYSDALFIHSLINLAMFRKTLAPEQKKIVDYLLDILPGTQQHPAIAVSFINEIQEPLFTVIQPGRYLNPQEVANHLVNYGYPESQNPSLYQYFLQGDPDGYMPAAAEAIAQRGSLPEEQLLKHGQTFADRHSGHTVEELLDKADTVLTITTAIAATVNTAGAASPAIGIAMGRVAAKQAAKRMAKGAAKALAKGAAKLPKFIRPFAKAGARMGGKVLTKAAQKAPRATILAPRVANMAKDIYDIWDGVKTAKKVYFGLGGSSIAFEIGQMEPELICPGKPQE